MRGSVSVQYKLNVNENYRLREELQLHQGELDGWHTEAKLINQALLNTFNWILAHTIANLS